MHAPHRHPSSLSGRPLLLLAACSLLLAAASAADSPDRSTLIEPTFIEDEPTPFNHVIDGPDPISTEHLNWLVEVQPLITGREYRFFRNLERTYQRDAFIEAFWRVRDPYPRTARNELKERWPFRVAEAKSKFGALEDDRSRIFLVHGPPTNSFEVRCSKTRSPVEVWSYRGTQFTDINAVLIFFNSRYSDGQGRLWRPGYSDFSADSLMRRAEKCINGQEILRLMSVIRANTDQYEVTLARLLAKPRPSSEEWLDSFQAFSTDAPEDSVQVAGEVDFAFLGRHQHRTVVQGLVSLKASDVEIGEFAGHRSFDFQLNGEVLKDGELFENFRYKFGMLADSAAETLPISFQRFLRPGDYRMILRVDDLNSDRVFRVERALEVPQADNVLELPMFKDPETARIFEEATAALASGETRVQLIPPRGDLQTGFTRFDAMVSGDEITKVRFVLDDKPILTKNRPPFQVSIDLGPYPDLRSLRVEGLDASGEIAAEDELLINSGGYRFVVKLTEPRAGKSYEKSLQARAEVEVPEGRNLERLEIYLNETLTATLYQEPFAHPIVLPEGDEVAYVRAVGYLPDGNTTEDLVFINAPGEVEELEVQFVELYTSVLDSQGRPVDGLQQSEIKVLEDGVPQTISRFEEVKDLPIHVGILLDNSASMAGVLGDVRRAALTFIDQAISPKDRASVMTFNSFPELKVSLTNDKTALGAGLAGLSPEGRTALYDSVMFGLYYFTGIKGQRALLILSDGKDESSRFDFDQTLEYARRAGITLYTIGLRLGDGGARSKLSRLAFETGGESFFIRDVADLESIYGAIERDLRSQLLIAYQSSSNREDGEFRKIDLEVARSDLSVRTISGYYP
ncbi:MAG: VWA domain-containing protein [Acidobacteriota bacterium]